LNCYPILSGFRRIRFTEKISHNIGMNFIRFTAGSVKIILRGSLAYYIWVVLLLLVILWGALGYAEQLQEGLIRTHMRDSVSWAFYIGNFTFLVGIAAAAVMLVIPAYVYHWKPISEIVIFAELLAVCALIMSISFVVVDIGKPQRFWHMIPLIGTMNFPSSMLSWDLMFLLAYFIINLVVVIYLLNHIFHKRDHKKSLVLILVFISIPLAIGIHTITAFIYSSLAARPFWHSALLAPRFLASAFSSGLALLLILFQLLRRTTRFEINDEAIWKIADIMRYTIFIYLFFIFSELFNEFYAHTENAVYWKYLLFGIGTHSELVVFTWSSIIMGVIAIILLLVSITRKNFVILNITAILIFASVYIEKGIAMIIPGFTPDVLGQVYVYSPSWIEIRTALLILASGMLLFTLLAKIAIAILFDGYSIDVMKTNRKSTMRRIENLE
jgi:Ni/Fe-hydrogenase subunit HybB-like protein